MFRVGWRSIGFSMFQWNRCKTEVMYGLGLSVGRSFGLEFSMNINYTEMFWVDFFFGKWQICCEGCKKGWRTIEVVWFYCCCFGCHIIPFFLSEWVCFAENKNNDFMMTRCLVIQRLAMEMEIIAVEYSLLCSFITGNCIKNLESMHLAHLIQTGFEKNGKWKVRIDHFSKWWKHVSLKLWRNTCTLLLTRLYHYPELQTMAIVLGIFSASLTNLYSILITNFKTNL